MIIFFKGSSKKIFPPLIIFIYFAIDNLTTTVTPQPSIKSNSSFIIKNMTPGAYNRIYTETGNNNKSDSSRNSSCSIGVARNSSSDVNKSELITRDKSISLDRMKRGGIERRKSK